MTAYIGLFPAAGLAKRLGQTDCSKEIMPVSLAGEAPRPVGAFLLEAWSRAGIDEAVVIGRPEKTDLQSTLKDVAPDQLILHFLHAKHPWGTPFSLDSAFHLVKERPVALGFPDILLQPQDVFLQLRQSFESEPCDVLLGLFPAAAPERSDMVELSSSGDIHRLHIKPALSDLTQTWGAALWRPSFSAFLHDFIRQRVPEFIANPHLPEPFVGTVINQAIRAGLVVKGISVREGEMFDIGTPESLAIARTGAFLDRIARY